MAYSFFRGGERQGEGGKEKEEERRGEKEGGARGKGQTESLFIKLPIPLIGTVS